MIELTGQAGRKTHKQAVRELGMGHMRTAVPKKHWRLPKRGEVYAVDNGKFGADTNNRPWNDKEFLEVLGRIWSAYRRKGHNSSRKGLKVWRLIG